MTRYWGWEGHVSDSIFSDLILGRRGTLVTRYWGEGHISDSILGGRGTLVT